MTISYQLSDHNICYIDVRSPREFRDGCIPGAFNLPLFTDEAHELVGTCYKQKGESHAKKIAMGHVASRLPEIYESFLEIERQAKEEGRSLVMYCARGGMRSKSLQGLLENIGHSVERLDGGYKAYRQTVINTLETLCKEAQFIVLHGATGVGKTEVLKGLAAMGHGVIDIEGICEHRGSMLGRIGKPEQPSQKNFEHLLLSALMAGGKAPIFVEAESKRLGRNTLPDAFIDAMKRGRHLDLTADLTFRKDILIGEYVPTEETVNELIEVLNNFRKPMGHKMVDDLQEAMRAGDLGHVAEVLMIQYYDPKYKHASKDVKIERTYHVNTIDQTVNELDLWRKADQAGE